MAPIEQLQLEVYGYAITVGDAWPGDPDPLLTPCAREPFHTLADLKSRRQWVLWRYEQLPGDKKPRKVPYSPITLTKASTSNPATWGYFDDIRPDPRWNGVGFVFTRDDPYFGIDLDDCRNKETGELSDRGRHIIQRFDSYAEITPSYRGIHIIGMGKLPYDAHRNNALGVEIYDKGQYFTMTFNHLASSPDRIYDRQELLGPFQRKYFPQLSIPRPPPISPETDLQMIALSDDEVIERVRRSPRGDYWWSGGLDIGEKGKPDHSLTDYRLLKLIRFFVGDDPLRIEGIFRRSGLMRTDHHGRSMEIYLDRTIKQVLGR